jgi:hypothetical protein
VPEIPAVGTGRDGEPFFHLVALYAGLVGDKLDAWCDTCALCIIRRLRVLVGSSDLRRHFDILVRAEGLERVLVQAQALGLQKIALMGNEGYVLRSELCPRRVLVIKGFEIVE